MMWFSKSVEKPGAYCFPIVWPTIAPNTEAKVTMNHNQSNMEVLPRSSYAMGKNMMSGGIGWMMASVNESNARAKGPN